MSADPIGDVEHVHAGVVYDLRREADGLWRWRRRAGGEWSRAYPHVRGARMAIAAHARDRARTPLQPARACEHCTRRTRGREFDPEKQELYPACPPGVGCGIGLPVTPPASGGTMSGQSPEGGV